MLGRSSSGSGRWLWAQLPCREGMSMSAHRVPRSSCGCSRHCSESIGLGWGRGAGDRIRVRIRGRQVLSIPLPPMLPRHPWGQGSSLHPPRGWSFPLSRSTPPSWSHLSLRSLFPSLFLSHSVGPSLCPSLCGQGVGNSSISPDVV